MSDLTIEEHNAYQMHNEGADKYGGTPHGLGKGDSLPPDGSGENLRHVLQCDEVSRSHRHASEQRQR